MKQERLLISATMAAIVWIASTPVHALTRRAYECAPIKHALAASSEDFSSLRSGMSHESEHSTALWWQVNRKFPGSEVCKVSQDIKSYWSYECTWHIRGIKDVTATVGELVGLVTECTGIEPDHVDDDIDEEIGAYLERGWTIRESVHHGLGIGILVLPSLDSVEDSDNERLGITHDLIMDIHKW